MSKRKPKTHRSSDGCRIDGPPGPDCGCQSCRSRVRPLTIEDRISALAQSSRCGCESLGIIVNHETLEIERCDECNVFDNDAQAAAFVVEMLQAAHRAHAPKEATRSDAQLREDLNNEGPESGWRRS